MNKILWKCMSKDQAWKIISFLHTNRPIKNFSGLSQTGKWQIFFHIFQDCVWTLHVCVCKTTVSYAKQRNGHSHRVYVFLRLVRHPASCPPHMGQDVVPTVPRGPEGHVALGALERARARVAPDVDFQASGGREGFLAKLRIKRRMRELGASDQL